MAPTVRPLSPAPDRSVYEHLTEKQRMIAGYPYRPGHEELCVDRANARRLIYKFNNTDPDDEKTRQDALKALFNPDSKDKKFFVEPPFRVDYGYNISVGNNLQANFGLVILDCAAVTIGDNCLIAPNVHIYAATHPLDPKHRQDNDDYYELAKPVKIGNNVWIGGQTTICPGVTIGDNCVIGAGSVVVRDVPANVVVAGNPAKVIRQLDVNESS